PVLLALLAQVFQGLVQHPVAERLLLLLRFRRRLRLGRAGPAYNIAFASPLVIVRPLLVGQLHLEALRRLHAPFVRFLGVREAVNVLAVGAPVAGRRQLQGTRAVLQQDDVLHTALAVTALADDDGPQVVLQGGCDDLAGTGAIAVDQDRNRTRLGVGQQRPLA